MSLKALIFDVDGTLAETEESHRAAFNAIFDVWGLGWTWSQDTYRDLLKTTGGKERIRVFQAGLADAARRLSEDEIARLHAEKTRAYGQVLSRGGMKLRAGVAELIAMARQAGLRIAVATTTSRSNVDQLCQCCWGRAGDQVFDVIAAGDDVGAKKPAPDVYELALARLELAAGAVLAFEDSHNGVVSAKGAGLQVLVTPSRYSDRDDFSAADWVVPTVEAVHWPAVLREMMPG